MSGVLRGCGSGRQFEPEQRDSPLPVPCPPRGAGGVQLPLPPPAASASPPLPAPTGRRPPSDLESFGAGYRLRAGPRLCTWRHSLPVYLATFITCVHSDIRLPGCLATFEYLCT